MNVQGKYGWIICYKLFCTSCHPGAPICLLAWTSQPLKICICWRCWSSSRCLFIFWETPENWWRMFSWIPRWSYNINNSYLVTFFLGYLHLSDMWFGLVISTWPKKTLNEFGSCVQNVLCKSILICDNNFGQDLVCDHLMSTCICVHFDKEKRYPFALRKLWGQWLQHWIGFANYHLVLNAWYFLF